VGDEDEIRLVAAYLDADVNATDEDMFNFTVPPPPPHDGP
jgi:hypothetical protein